MSDMHTQLYLHQPLKPKLQELRITDNSEEVKFSLAVVDFQSLPLCWVPIGANRPAVELTAGNRAVVQVSI